MKKKSLLIVFLLLCFIFPTSTLAVTYTNIVAFGDSLSDNGNADGYGLWVSSNGPVWVDYLAVDLGVGLLDMAYGGARTDYHPYTGSPELGFGWQIQEYLSKNGGAVNPHTLFTIWIGGNDLLNITSDPTAVITKAVTNIYSGINSLVSAGAENILLMNMPNLGATPYLNGKNLGYGLYDDSVGGAMLAAGFNQALGLAVDPFRSAINLYEVDVFAMMGQFMNDDLFDNDTNMLQAADPRTTDSYMFWDAIHPTTYAHNLIAEVAYDKVAPVPEPATMLLLGSGLVGLMGLRRRCKRN